MLDHYKALEDKITWYGVPFAMKFLRTADALLGSKAKLIKGNTRRLQLKGLREKVYLKILEESDNRRMVDNRVLIDACKLIRELNYDESVARVVKNVYDEALKRSYQLNHLEIEELDIQFKSFQNIRALQFAPMFKKDMESKYKNTNTNALLRHTLGLHNKDVGIDYNAESKNLTLNTSGTRLSL